MSLDTPIMAGDNLTPEDRARLDKIVKVKQEQVKAITDVRAGRFVDLPDGESEEARFKRIMHTPAAWNTI